MNYDEITTIERYLQTTEENYNTLNTKKKGLISIACVPSKLRKIEETILNKETRFF